ncbi:DNA primase [Luminiphilus sp.]|nr:DNA primase [Luminiphilus sp.]
MARLSQAFLDDLLDRLDIVEVIDRRVKLKKAGKNYTACCPFHDERTPSFSVNPDKQFYYCFGCGAGGNALGFVMDYERLDFREAVEGLAQTVGLEIPEDDPRTGQEPPKDQNKPLYEILEQSSKFYEHALRQHPERHKVVNYLKARGLTGEIARDFRVGFAPEGWDNLIRASGDHPSTQERLMNSGMLVKNDKGRIYDRFRERVMFPIQDQRGRIIAFGGRVLGDDKPKYLNSPETPVFQKSRELYGLWQARKHPRRLERIVVVEGYMDVIALAQHGIPYAVATLGTSTSETHLERLFRLVPEVVFCFDGDDAGRKAAFRGLEATLPAMQDGRQSKFLFLPEGEDPDTLVRAKGKAYLENLFDHADPLEEFLFKHLADGLDLESMDGRARFSKLAVPYLDRLPEGVFQTLMYHALAERTGIDVESLKRLQPPPAPRPDPIDSTPPRVEAPPPLDPAELPPEAEQPPHEPILESLSPSSLNPIHRLLGLLVLKPALANKIPDNLMPSTGNRDAVLLTEVVSHIQQYPDVTTAALLGFWFGTPEGDFLSALAGRETVEDDAGLHALCDALIDKLNRHPALDAARKQVERLKRKAYADLSSEDKQALLTLTQEIRTLSGRH